LLQRLLLLVEVVPRLLARLLALLLLLLLLLWPRLLLLLLLWPRCLSELLLLQRQLLVLVGVGVLLRWLLWLRVMVLVGVAAARLACGVSCTAESCTFPSGTQGRTPSHTLVSP
jgi:hypothetical protein